MKLVSHSGTGMNVAHLKSICMFFLGYMWRSRTFWTLNSFKAWNIWHFAIFRIVSFSQHLIVTNLPMRLEKKKPWKWLSTPQFRKSMGVVRKTIQQRWDDATLMQPQLAKKGLFFKRKSSSLKIWWVIFINRIYKTTTILLFITIEYQSDV